MCILPMISLGGRAGGYYSCSEVKLGMGVKEDAEYPIIVGHRNVSIYCKDMNSSTPQEYLTLPMGEGENFAEIYNKR